jgi:Tol biopolymer transport system component/serine/threonine protein kinase
MRNMEGILGASGSPDPSSRLRRGQVIAGRYEIVRSIGRGPSAEVYEAADAELAVRVALKVIQPRITHDERSVRCIARSVVIARSLSTNYSNRVFDLARHGQLENESLVLTSTLLDGESLASRLKHKRRHSSADALPIVRQTALALSEIHAVHAVHGNLKPSNVMIVPDEMVDRIVVTDLGLSLSHLPQSRLFDPSASLYWAPEQLTGDEASALSDVYALGVILYEMVTGRLPFAREGTTGALAARTTRSFPRPSEIFPDLHPTWESAIMRCLEADPASRFETATEAVEALGPPSMSPRSRRTLRPDGIVEPDVTVETLVMTDLLDSTRLVDALGDARAAEVFEQHDRVARDLLFDSGMEIDHTDGFLLLFDRPSTAVSYTVAYHRRLRDLSDELGVTLAARVGIHIGEVRLRRNSQADIQRGAKHIEVEGLSKPVVARLTSLATGGQTLLTKAAFDVAKRATVGSAEHADLRWMSHGRYAAQGLDEPLDVFEVGIEGEAPLVAPVDSDKARRIPDHGGRRSYVIVAATVAFMIAAGAAGTTWFRDPEVPRPIASRRLTSAPGWEAEPALSPDGTLVAYSSDEKGLSDIWIVDIKGTSSLRITDDPAQDRTPVWFPDGNSIAFASDRGGAWGIWRVPRLGGAATLLVPNALDPAISPDGTRIAFARETSSANKTHTIWTAPLSNTADGTRLTRENDGYWAHRHPSWRPDSTELAFEDSNKIWLVPPAGGAARALTSSLWSRWPAWSSDGRNIYYSSSDTETTSALWRIPRDGGRAMRLTPGTGPEVQPHVARDGSRLVYSSYATTSQLVMVDLVNHTSKPVYTAPRGDRLQVAIAPDAKRLVFSDAQSLWLQELSQVRTEPRKIATVSLSHPTFSPDGTVIAGYSLSGSQRDVWTVQVNTGLPQRFTDTDSASETQPSWSPDGSRIAYVSDLGGVNQIWIAHVDNGRRLGEPQQLTTDGAPKYWPVWSPDGSLIAYIVAGSIGHDSLWIIKADARESARQLSAQGDLRFLRWGPTASQLFVTGIWNDECPSLRAVSIESGEVTQVDPTISFGNAGVGNFDVARNNKLVATVVEETRGDIWLLEATPGTY